jgi:hypothetical protein
MRFDPALEFVGHKIGNRFAISANDERPAGIFDSGQETRKVCFGFMHVDSLHVEMLVQLVHYVNR